MKNLNERAEKIKLSNEKFLALSPARQRVKIAKDVIKSLGTGKISAKKGTYWSTKEDVIVSNMDLQSRKGSL